MERFPDLTRARLKQLAGDMKALIYPQVQAVNKLAIAGPVDRIPHGKAVKLNYKPVKLGQQLGPQWSTFWFRIEAKVPNGWAGKRIDFLWNSLSEATLWLNGEPMQGLNFLYGERPDAVLTQKAKAGQKFSFYVEMACNTPYGVWLEDKSQHIHPYSLERCEIAVFDSEAWQMYLDFVVLQELETELSTDNSASDAAFAGTLLFELNRFANEYNLSEKSTWHKASKILKDLYKNHNASASHRSYAAGHGHLDTAWLWPIAETYRKLLRTWTNQLAIMDMYDDYQFAFSAAFHYQAVKDRYPEIYKRAKQKAKTGQWLPVGGTWIEPDCNMPSGEALARQFLYGQRFFKKEFGKRCHEFFNPDVFGYCAQLPQIMKQSGIDYFITCKLHENELNKPAHNTFNWQGIDGSQVLTHFPPLRFFTVPATVSDMRNVLKRFRDHDRSNKSLILYGYGDGGGGPTKEMVERLRRYKDLQALPKTTMAGPAEFFAAVVPDKSKLSTQIGEIYFEYHRGTYTSQAWIKKANRQAEFLLHDIEFLCAVAHRTRAFHYPQKEIEALWKLLLLNQMHDILPGSSIKLVYDDARKDFAEIQSVGEKIKSSALAAIIAEKPKSNKANYEPINTIPFERHSVCQTPKGELVFVRAPAYGAGAILELEDLATNLSDRSLSSICPSIIDDGKKIILENSHLKAEFSHSGDLISLIEKSTKREALVAHGNRLQIFVDTPAIYDAWQLELYHLETQKDCPPAHKYSIRTGGYESPPLQNLKTRAEASPTPTRAPLHDSPRQNGKKYAQQTLRVEVKFERRIGDKSSMTQTVRLDAGSRYLEFHCHVNWQEEHKVLKVLFPVDVKNMNATYDIQYGSIERPTHFNTPFDLAKFEVCAHKWSDLSEHSFGVALLSDCKYGYSTFNNEMRLTLLRAPKKPDDTADIGEHEFSYAIMPHVGSWQHAGVVAEAYKFNVPISWAKSSIPLAVRSFFELNDNNLVLETIKKAEDSEAIVLRLYECHGARGAAKLKVHLPFSGAVFCNILEDQFKTVKAHNNELTIPYEPFQIISIKLT